KLIQLPTDGAPALIGKNNGFIALFKQSVDHEILTYHCLIHQEQLCAQKLNMKHLMTDIVEVVNFIRSRGLNHRQCKAYLEEVGSEYEDVVYFSKVRWLSRAATLKRFKLLLPEIKQFMETKKQNVNFIENEEWLNDLAFLVDITEMLAHLNLHLQGKAQDCSVNYEKYAKLCEDLLQEFTDRFSDFKKIEIELKLFSDPFSFQCDKAPPNFQLELIELQSRESLKTYHREHTLPLFYKELHLCNELNQLVKLSRKLLCMWGSTYCCEQVFSSM
uniref:HAT C-terminal dimerisation domain-containing protein n=1 Tax=Ciona savignyi TaxID=51511 RepID=H2Y679_CIOSA